MTGADARFLKLALSLGRRGQGLTWPNPAVGCVIVQDGRIVGRGWTQPGGRPHAERMALAQAGSAARGATAYVSLEPCAHHGKTPPCADALIAAGVTRVVAPLSDVDKRVEGKGFQMLRDAGVTVDTGLLAGEALQDHAGFFFRVQSGRPRVTLKLAASLDGRIATATGQSQWITGPLARRWVHGQRARHDAVIVGGGTARSDDPSLTVRDLGMDHQPVRIVVSRLLDLPLLGQLARTATTTPVWICHGPEADPSRIEAWATLGAKLLAVPVSKRHVDLAQMLRQLGDLGLTRLFCEGGAALSGSLLADDLVDELQVWNAGLAIGAEGLPAVGALGLNDLGLAQRFSLVSSQSVGGDVLSIWRR